MELKGSKTEANLWIAFAGESQARNKYDYFASKAKKEGYEQIAAIFQETALNEKEHAKLWFKHLGELGDTAENLLHAAEGENAEWTDMYARMAREADEEGFHDLAEQFRGVAAIEKVNIEKAKLLYDYLDESRLFHPVAQKEFRSRMNVTFNTGDPDKDAAFVKAATAAGLLNLKGHRLVGGMRASIYNAMPPEGVRALVEFMKKFEMEHK